MISIAIRALSRIDLPSTNADCSSDTHLDKHPFNLFAKSFDTILYITLHNEIGLNSFMVLGFSHLGIRQIFVSFREAGK
jgi:hypothetical protein